MKAERQSNIELLRILASMAVIILHYINPNAGGALLYVKTQGGVNEAVMRLLESLFANAVNLFIMIMGYFMCQSQKRDLWKPIELIVQTSFICGSLQVAAIIWSGQSLSIETLAKAFVPRNYFVILYCCVYVISPYINILIDSLSKRILKLMVTTIMIVFCAYPTLVDAVGNITGFDTAGLSSIGLYGSQWGYTIVNFVIMYIMGVYVRKCNLKCSPCQGQF